MSHTLFSAIVPVYNRPQEVEELLESLTQQQFNDFEVIIVEDGSSIPCKQIVDKFEEKIRVKYYFKENTGPGTSRNYGALRADGDFFIFFDSDCIVPAEYFNEVTKALTFAKADAFGGPDRAHPSFTNIQKAINYSMTSVLTSGGIRGGKERMDKFYPRSFNMGISREAFEKTGGFASMRFGEDVDLSLRIVSMGFTTRLIPSAYVYHKRRTDFCKFFRQVYNSGIARINLHVLHPGSLKLVHLLPSAFVVGMAVIFITALLLPFTLLIPLIYSLLVFFHSLYLNSKFSVAFLSIGAVWVQLFGYGIGFIHAAWKRLIMQKQEFNAFQKNFY
jgi:glycosyltransferase involved in cell wall biosynthesis